MFNRKTPTEISGLEKAIDSVLLEMAAHKGTEDEYTKLVEQLVKLHAMKEAEKPTRIDPNTVLQASVSVFGVLVIANYEKAGVWTSKAWDLVKGKK